MLFARELGFSCAGGAGRSEDAERVTGPGSSFFFMVARLVWSIVDVWRAVCRGEEFSGGSVCCGEVSIAEAEGDLWCSGGRVGLEIT